MREMIKMVVVLTILSFFSGGVLAYLRNSTQERIDNQVLEFVKGPAVRTIFEGAGNNPIADRFTIEDGEVTADEIIVKGPQDRLWVAPSRIGTRASRLS